MATLCYCFHGCTAASLCFVGDFYEKRRLTLIVINLLVKMT